MLIELMHFGSLGGCSGVRGIVSSTDAPLRIEVSGILAINAVKFLFAWRLLKLEIPRLNKSPILIVSPLYYARTAAIRGAEGKKVPPFCEGSCGRINFYGAWNISICHSSKEREFQNVTEDRYDISIGKY